MREEEQFVIVTMDPGPGEEAGHGLGQQLVRHHGLELGEGRQEGSPSTLHKHHTLALGTEGD